MAEQTKERAAGFRFPRRRVVNLVAAVIRWAGRIFAVLLLAQIVLVVGGANPSNGITQFVAGWADRLTLGFRDLFMPDDLRVRVLVDYGLAAIFWLVLTSIVVRLVRRLA